MIIEKITFGKVVIWTSAVVLTLLAFVFLWNIKGVIFLLFLSILLATGIEPVVNWLRRGPFNRGSGILVVYTFIFAVIALVLYLSIPPLVQEGQVLVKDFTNPTRVREIIAGIPDEFFRNIAGTVYENISVVVSNYRPDASTLSVGLTVAEVVFSSFSVFVIAYYWLTERTQIKRLIFNQLPEGGKKRFLSLWDSVEHKFGDWVRGQLLLMLFIGIFSFVGYSIIGLKFALVLALFAALTELIPMVGPYIGGAPAVVIALTQGLPTALAVLVFIIVLQLVEGNFLVPRLMEKTVGVTPLTVIVGVLVGSALAGISGALLAVPVAAALQVIINNLLSYSAESASPETAQEASKDFISSVKLALDEQS
jgi:predicted PurR-regulated permease PerM